jgi:hypothetical protein
MDQFITIESHREPWNKGKLVGQKAPLSSKRSGRSAVRTTVDDTRLYRSKNLEYASCPLKSQCCPNTPNRKIARSLYETARDVTHAVVAAA